MHLCCASWFKLLIDFAINFVSGIAIFLLGLFWPHLPKTYRQLRLRQFFGSGTLTNNGLAICYGSLRVDRAACQHSPFVKFYRDGMQRRISGPSELVMGDSEIRSITHLVQEFAKYRKSPAAVSGDIRAIEDLDKTIVAIGSDSSNEMTRLILAEPNNLYLEFDPMSGVIRSPTDKTVFEGFKEPIRKDYGIVLKLSNQRFPGKFFFVCAGLGDWGSSGAAWYLANRWQQLRREFDGCFGLVVEV